MTMITNKNYNVDLANLPDKKLMYEVATETFFDDKALGIKSISDKSLIKLLESPGKMVSASGVSPFYRKKSLSNLRWLSSKPNKLCDRLRLFIHEKKSWKNSDIINEEIIAIA